MSYKPSDHNHPSPSERLQKVLARAGLGSRREIETWISNGRITVNGKTALLGDRICNRDKVKLDQRALALFNSLPVATRVLAYYKPHGEVCTRRDPENRKTVFEKLPKIKKGRWIAIGRLDINTSGLLLFTNNGELANRMMHPSNNIEREYAVRIFGRASDRQLNKLLSGIQLEDGLARFTDIVYSGGRNMNHWYHVVLMEGRNREVRRLWESQELTVNRLIRVRFGSYILPRKNKSGQYWELNKKEIAALSTR